jgi:hypothetical protein
MSEAFHDALLHLEDDMVTVLAAVQTSVAYEDLGEGGYEFPRFVAVHNQWRNPDAVYRFAVEIVDLVGRLEVAS